MLPTEQDLTALWLTLQLASLTTIILLLLGTPFAWWLANTRHRWKVIPEALVALPLILPPTVLGFYLLLAFAPDGALGAPWQWLTGSGLAFTFTGLLIGSVLYSLPFVVQPLQGGFEQLDQGMLQAARSLGAGRWSCFRRIVLPLCRRSFLTAVTLGFAHTVGEFGVVLMIGGNIPGSTQVLSIALYDHVETLDYGRAHWLAGGLLLFSVSLLLVLYSINHRQRTEVIR
ncbi:molybdate ABC transporter permease subunit [Marinobacterium sediminicola]|uniref:Molybdenum transport system permease n=1 Tax=Marinobacterium sediminicola TaxID=518898 RepID=A0ABY1RZU1_9GAMM|nr:molybdate ABC transporter permease subunit [Marinobacterium sediminicola]ULG69998.1 molybdate ABC transporter permease subunit [Marinobacterium sediminicola]SMR74452.1 molybdate transport system permease protein [Marinobacterium sediminicola]